MPRVNTLFSTRVVVRKVQGYIKDSCGTRARYGTTISDSSDHCLYRMAKLRRDWDTRAMRRMRVIGGMLSLGGMVLALNESS